MTDLKISDFSDGGAILYDDEFVIARSSSNKKIGGNQIGVSYRKTTSKQVVNTVTETDLLNSEITIAANAMGTDRLLRLIAFGDWLNNTAGGTDVPRLRLKLGGTTLIDDAALGASAVAPSGSRWGWVVKAEILNLGATNSQWANYWRVTSYNGLSPVPQWNSFATGNGRHQGLASDNTHSQQAMAEGGGSGAIDTTVAQALTLTAVLSSASASHDITLKGAFAKIE